MVRNKLFADDRVVQAAFSLAKMVKQHGKPVVFDMDLYMELVLGHSAPQLGEHLDKYIRGIGDAKTEEELRKIKLDLSQLEAAKQVDRGMKHHFIEALSDAFTFNDVHAEYPCSIFEIGHTSMYSEGLLKQVIGKKPKKDNWMEDEESREYAWVFMVIRTPSPNEVAYIPL